MREVGGQSPQCAADLLLGLRHGKSNSTDESITEMNEDSGVVIHETGGLGPARVSRFTMKWIYNASHRTHWAFIPYYLVKCGSSVHELGDDVHT